MNARILLTDIETTPITVHTWGLRDLSVGLNQIIEHPQIMGVGWRWFEQRHATYAPYRTGAELEVDNRETMLRDAWRLLDTADVVVHYNGDRFDIPWLYGEFAKEGMTPPSPFKSLDLYKVVKKNFRLPSHKLAYVSEHLGLAGKLDTGGHTLWRRVMAGDAKAQKKMAAYCRRDVDLLGDLLVKLRPWLPATINFALMNGFEDLACQKCGSPEYLRPKGTAWTGAAGYPQYLCCPDRGGCGGWTRDLKSVISTRGRGVQR